MADDATSVASSSRPPSPSTETDSLAPLPTTSSRIRTAPGPYRFHWDPTASKRQGPPSVSDATESRLELDIPSASATPPPTIFEVGTGSSALPPSWSSSQNGFNAISTVLNNPHSRPNPLKSNRAPIFTGPSPDLPRIRRKDFDPYLKAIGPEWARFEKNQKQARREALELEQSAIPSPLGSQEDIFSPTSGQRKKGAPPPLDVVPSVYFEPDFNLGTPKTFAAVSERREEDGPGPSEEDPQVNQDLQDRLSGYLDVVEQHLTIEIQARSSSFFAALSNLQSLQAEGAQCLSRVSNLRHQLVEVDEKQAKRGLQIARLRKRRENMQVVQEGIRSIHAVGESVGLIKGLVATGGYFEALAMIDQLEGMFEPSDPATSRPKTLPLGEIIALAPLPSSLRELATSIASSLSADLVAMLRADLLRDRWPEELPDPQLQDRMSPLLHALVKTGGVDDAMKAYQDVVTSEIKVCVQKHLPPSEWDDDHDATAAASEVVSSATSPDVRTLPHEDFMKLASSMFDTLLSRLHTLSAHITAITTLLASFTVHNTTFAAADSTSPSGLATLLTTCTEMANARASKLIGLRTSAHSQLPLPSFLAIFNLAWTFVIKSEVLTRRMIVGLRGVIVGQAKSWLTAFHAERLGKAARAVEEETWTQVEVPANSQKTVDLIVESAVKDPKEYTIVLGEDVAPNGAHSDTAVHGAKLLNVDDHPYFVVAATLEVLELLVDYLKVIVNLQLLTTDAMGRIIEYLKAFNSRTCQVVLGAGAMRSAGLKNITAKHLALASQSLSVMIALVPYIRETLRRHLNPKQAVILVEFDKLKRDYQEHQYEIHSKLIAIMGDRLSVHCKALQDINWEQPAPKPGPNPYMEVLVKETVVLHKVLSKYLAEGSVEMIMTQVFAAINHRLSEEYGKIELPSQEAKTRMLQDAKYMQDKLSSLKGVSLHGSMLETVVMEKSVPRKGSPFPIRRSSTLPQNGTPDSGSRRPSGLGSPLVNGSGSPRGSRPGTPTLHALLAGGRSSPSPSPMPTPPAGRDTPNSPLSRSPLASPRLSASDLPRAQSPAQWPSSPRQGPLPLIVKSPPPPEVELVTPLPVKPPPTPPKDRVYLPPSPSDEAKSSSTLTNGDMPAMDSPEISDLSSDT